MAAGKNATFEARFYLATKEIKVCLGCVGGPTKKFTAIEILSQHNKTTKWIKSLVQHYDEFIDRSPFEMEPNSSVSIAMAQEVDINHAIIKFWLSPSDPICTLKYQGYNKIESNLPGNPNIMAHQWEASLDSIMIYQRKNVETWLQEFWTKETNFQPDSFLVLQLSQTDIYVAPTLECLFRPIGDHPSYIKAMEECPPNCYLIEMRYPPRGWFAYIKKSDWDEKKANALIFV